MQGVSRDEAGKLVSFFGELQCSKKIEADSKVRFHPLAARTVACPECN